MAINKVLIVDESSDRRTQIREMLPQGKFEILEALDGEEAMLLFDLERETLRLVIFNFELQSVSGWEVLKKLQTDEKLQKIPAIAMADSQDKIAAKVPPPYFDYIEVLALPCDRKTLQQAIKSAVSKSKLPRQPLPLEPLECTNGKAVAEPAPEDRAIAPEATTSNSTHPVPPADELEPLTLQREEIAAETEASIEAVEPTEATPEELQPSAVATEVLAGEEEENLAAVASTPYEYFNCLQILSDRDAWGVGCLAVSLDGQFFVSGSETTPMKVWSLMNGTLEAQWNLYSQGTSCLLFAPDGQTIITGAAKTNIKFWGFATGELLGPLNDYSCDTSAIAITPDAQTLIAGALHSNIKLWDLQTGELICPLNDDSFGTTALAIAADGRTLIAGFEHTNIKLWDFATGELLGPLNIESSRVTSLVLSPDNQLVISGHSNGFIQFSDLYSGEVLRAIKAHEKPTTAIAISPDGQLIVSASESEIKLWGVA